ncbi:TolC family protein [Arhodomonas aquaeolei]|uniref:TolC family protein n=1 Tax=Arhodomonas aquaeolei TaxID=2369 RepID=UPI00216A1C3E|nr:TolC family protein [Arhodomonas aquaeolei]MCS4502550.1 TolC family protein [Arhodomonas aquaeolei]
MRRLLTLTGLVLAATLLGGCAVTAPETDYPDRAREAIGDVTSWPALDGGEPTAYLNQLVGSSRLDALIQEALAANPNLQQTLLTLRIRRSERRQTGADRLPDLDTELTGSREEDSDTRYTGSVTVSWEADVWGRIADTYRAADLDVAEQRALYQSTRDTLASEVMDSWLQLIADRRAVDIQTQRLGTLQDNLTFVRERYRKGIGDIDELDTARTDLASARATLAEYREDLASERRSLREMLGRSDDAEIPVPSDYPGVRVPLVDLPVQTLGRRPDLRADYIAIQAQAARTRAAYKDMLPSLDLQASLEDVAATPRQALLTAPVWSLLADLTAPLYRGGELKAAAEQAELEAAKAYQAYRETLLTAVTEVGDAIGQEQALKTRLAHTRDALASARRSLANYRRRYRAGLVTILDLLDVQEQTYDLKAQLNELTRSRLANRVDLGLALGLGVHR